MAEVNITPIILAGGTGTRLWPLSRKSYPKQFSKLLGEKSLFQMTVERLCSTGRMNFSKPVILTNNDFRFMVAEHLNEIGIDPGPIIIEPASKNTAPAILAACKYLLKTHDPTEIVLVAPSDHVIPDTEHFHDALLQGLSEVQKGRIVTFGIEPESPETGYGYLKLADGELNEPSAVAEFVEKPDYETASEMLKSKRYLWNAGIFLFRIQDIMEEYEKQVPSLISAVSASVESGEIDLGFFRLERDAWSLCDNLSVDYAVMEGAGSISAVRLSSHWTDLGDWSAVSREMNDENGMSLSQNAFQIDCSNSMLRSENESQVVVGLGLENLLVVAMSDAVLVANKNEAQKVKNVVELLKKHDVMQAEKYFKDFRPWGWFESLVSGARFQVKKICVLPGAALSLQSHHHRSEHWIVVVGTAKVTIDGEIKMVAEGQSVYVPLGAIHRMENPGKIPMMLIEVQTGSYLGEDDIFRFEDKYDRK